MTVHSIFRASHAIPALLLTVAILVLGGCAGDESSQQGDTAEGSADLAMATVGSRTITVGQYERSLAGLKQEELPKDADGLTVDTSTPEGKQLILNILVNNEIQAMKAIELGYDDDQEYRERTTAVSEFSASALMLKELITDPAQVVDDAAVDAYYEKLGTERFCRFLICKFHDDAEAARQAVLAGDLWEDVAEEYHEGYRGVDDDFRQVFGYGKAEDSFEEAIFDLEIGEVSKPVATPYGWFILRLEEVRPSRVKPLTDSFREDIRRTIVEQRTNLGRKRFIEESRERHDFSFSETALWIVFQGLTPGEATTYPNTRTPVPATELNPLNVDSKDLDRVFFSYRPTLDAEPDIWTIGDYKQFFDGLSGAQRPKRDGDLMMVRNRIISDFVDRQLLIAESEERGFMAREEVSASVKDETESKLIARLLEDVVQFDQRITPEQLDEHWSEFGEYYIQPEIRKGRVVYCEDSGQAELARSASAAGTPWDDIIDTYELTAENKEAGGRFILTAGRSGPLAATVFGMEGPGSLSEIFLGEEGFGVARLDVVEPQRQQTIDEARNAAGNRIKTMRRREALSRLLEQWRDEYAIVIHEETLAKARSWDELTGAI